MIHHHHPLTRIKKKKKKVYKILGSDLGAVKNNIAYICDVVVSIV
jgi:transcription initiation factor IIE alpha subunit